MSKSDLLSNYSPSQIEKIEIQGSGELYDNLIEEIEQLGISYEEKDVELYSSGKVRINVFTDSIMNITVTENDLENKSIEEMLS